MTDCAALPARPPWRRRAPGGVFIEAPEGAGPVPRLKGLLGGSPLGLSLTHLPAQHPRPRSVKRGPGHTGRYRKLTERLHALAQGPRVG
jgi:hypothetical protein